MGRTRRHCLFRAETTISRCPDWEPGRRPPRLSQADESLIARRLATRHDHFMPRDLLHSQFEALEEPGPDENPVVVSIELQPREIVRRILVALNLLDEAER